MRLKQWLCCLLALAMLLCATACRGDETDPPESDTSGSASGTGETTGEGDSGSATAPYTVVKDGASIAVVYPMDDLSAMKLANNVATKIKNLTGVTAECRSDSRLITENEDLDSYEILVGAVDYSCYETALARLAYGESAVLVEGHKLMVISGTGDGLSSIVNKLLALLTTAYDKASGVLEVSGDLYLSSSANELGAAIPKFEGKTLSGLYKSTSTAAVAYFQNVTESEMDSYQQAVLGAGYALYAGDFSTGKSATKNNRFLTFQNDTHVLSICYNPSNKELRVIAEKQSDTSLGWNETDGQTSVTKVCDATFTMVGICYDMGYFNGMSFVMRLEDGSFIVVDGGHNLQKNADRLYKILQEQAPDPEHIVIAAWIFSHAHDDHVGFFPQFSKLYAKQVTVERFIYNLPIDSQFDSQSTAGGNASVQPYVASYAGAKVINAHPGQVYYLHGAKIRILYTADMMLPTMMDYGNTASMGWTIEVAGVKTGMLGDLGAVVANTMLKYYSAEDLQCDVLQVAHHGIGSSPKALYPYIDPTYALFPIGTGPLSKWEGYTDDAISFVNSSDNVYFRNSEKCKDHIYIANDDVTILTYRNGTVAHIEQYDNDTAYFAASTEAK